MKLRPPPAPRDRGLSLIELVVAMAVFALIAVMGLQSLTGMLRSRDRLIEISESTHEISETLKLLRHDLSAAVPVLFYPPDRAGQESALRLTGNSTRVSVSIGGQPTLNAKGTTGALHRSEWRLDPATGILWRGVWPTLIPAKEDARHPDVVMLRGVDAITARSYWPDIGWTDGLRAPQGTDAPLVDSDDAGSVGFGTSTTLPLAVEMTLRTRAFGDIPLIQSLQ